MSQPRPCIPLVSTACPPVGSAVSTRCRSEVTQGYIDQCNGQQACNTIPACQSAYGQDPCQLSSKYLEVSYQCILPTILASSAGGSVADGVDSAAGGGVVAVVVIVALVAVVVVGAVIARRSGATMRRVAVLPQDNEETYYENELFAFEDHGVSERRWSEQP